MAVAVERKVQVRPTVQSVRNDEGMGPDENVATGDVAHQHLLDKLSSPDREAK